VHQQAGEEEDRDHDVQAKRQTVLAEVPVEEQHRQRDHDQAENAAVVQALGGGLPRDIARLGLFQQRRVDHFRRLRLHGPVQQR